MNPLVWKFIVEYIQSKRIDTGEYEITDPAGKKYRARQEGKETTGKKIGALILVVLRILHILTIPGYIATMLVHLKMQKAIY